MFLLSFSWACATVSLSRFALPLPSVESNLPLRLRNRSPPLRRYPTMDMLEPLSSPLFYHPHSCDYRPMKPLLYVLLSTHGDAATAAAAISPLFVLMLTPRLSTRPRPSWGCEMLSSSDSCVCYVSVCRAVPSPYPLPASRVPPRHVGVCVGRNQDQDRSFHANALCFNLRQPRRYDRGNCTFFALLTGNTNRIHAFNWFLCWSFKVEEHISFSRFLPDINICTG